jgi:uncharacterized protein
VQIAVPSPPNEDLVIALARSLGAELIRTHISWVLLTGDRAYKVKKPVRLAFLDYGTLQARQHFCAEEVRLNRSLAPFLYLGVSRVTGSREAPALDGPGAALEYAVRMRRFGPGALFGEQLQAGTLAGCDVDQLALLLARFHAGAAAAPAEAGFASPEHRRTAALAALQGASGAATSGLQAQLRGWLETESAALTALWTARQADGRVRECHGDLHLDNLIRVDGAVAAFDCIEFEPALRWIDVLDDIAFPVMDFAGRGRRDFAFRLLNGWLDGTGDHGALPALRFSLVYRALVRAQVARLRGAGHEAIARRYLDGALSWTEPTQPRLFITHGLPGSGKTFHSQRLLEHEGAIRLRSDVERKRLFGLDVLDDSRALGLDLYSEAATARTYERLLVKARAALGAGYPVILDAAFLRHEERVQAHAVARELGVPFVIVHCDAPLPELRERLHNRSGDASEADVTVLEKLHALAKPLHPDEWMYTRRGEEIAQPT